MTKTQVEDGLIFRIAIPQLLLALTALLISHVQIITRLASGSLLWYIWLADRMNSEIQVKRGGGYRWTGIVLQWMVVYAMIQGGLYASFLTPA